VLISIAVKLIKIIYSVAWKQKILINNQLNVMEYCGGMQRNTYCKPELCPPFLHHQITQNLYLMNCTGHTQKNGSVSKVDNKFISHHTRAQHTLSAAGTAQVSHALPAVRFSCLLRGRGSSFQDGVAAGESFLCVPF
jgi:hypothetical protein